MIIKELIKKLIYGSKYNSKTYINHLNTIGAKVADSVYFVAPSKVIIDETRPYLIEIGEFVTITEGCAILTHGFDWSVLKIQYGDVIGSAGKVTIKKNCFIGVNTTILKGVTIGENTIIGAGSVVTADIPDNCVAAGNPCRVICSLQEYYIKRKKSEKSEAYELISSYFDRYGVIPPPEKELSEFFTLFFKYNDIDLPDFYKRKLLYGGIDSYHKSLKKEYEPDFQSYAELCKAALENKDEI